MEPCLKNNAVAREAGETGSGATEEAQIFSISIHTINMEARFETVEKAGEYAKNHFISPKIQQIMSLLRDQQDFEMYYEPRAVSLGPIHHGKEKYELGERYKLVLTHEFVIGSGKEIKNLYKKIEDNIKELRECFVEEVTKTYDDEALAWLLFVDGCAILQHIYCDTADWFIKPSKIKTDLPTFGQQDLFLLENQLPYRLLKWLMGLSDMKKELEESIETYIAQHFMVPDDQQLKQQQTKGKRGNAVLSDEKIKEQIISMDKEPIHLLDHLRTKLLGKANLDSIIIRKSADQDWQSYRNVQEHQVAGIRLKRSCNSGLRNIYFRSRVLGFGHLYLPPIIVDELTRPVFLNLIAYERCMDFENDHGVISYIFFLNSLIRDGNDVKELRKARVFQSFLASDDDAAVLFKEIATNLVPNPYTYRYVRIQMNKHSKNLIKAWIAQFIHNYFSSPWTFLSLVGALLVLALTATQTWYAINSPRDDFCNNLIRNLTSER